MATVVMFHAHPDDEAILTAGTMARLAAAGHRVVLVVATRGEHGEVPDGLLVAGQTLGDRRTAETRWAADVLGVQRLEFLGYADSGMAGTATNRAANAFCAADVEEAAARLAGIVEQEQAEALTIYDDHGGYGHPDHVQVHRVGTRAAELVGDVAVYQATVNRDYLRQGMEQLAQVAPDAANLQTPEFGDDFGEPASAITHTIDVREYAGLKKRAMAAHSSQISETSLFLGLPDAAFVAGFGTEWFIQSRRRDDPSIVTAIDEISTRADTADSVAP